MADAYRRCGDNRENRPRSDSEVPNGDQTSSYYVHDNEEAGQRATRDTDFLNVSYELYLRSLPISSCGSETTRFFDGLEDLEDINDLRAFTLGRSAVQSPFMDVGVSLGGSDAVVAAQSRSIAVGGQPEIPLPHDASSTLFVEGLPVNCSRREVSHIFRPFLGYKEVRLVNKESRYPGGNPVVFCFVDFQSPAHAATAMDALQGYIFDEHYRDSCHLRLQFARSPGPRFRG